ncbi:MAG: class II aldolase/adducin family protein [Verrucomicrobiales bacterium]
MNSVIEELIKLSHEIGREDRRLTILGEGNTSARLDGGQIALKASGSCLGTLRREDVTLCHAAPLLKLLDSKIISDQAADQTLLDARVNGEGKKPSVEAVFHAWLLTLPKVNFVGHCHSLAANQILCSPRARDFAERRVFPDEVVCCGPASVFIPYTDPGVPLAREIKDRTNVFIKQHGTPPRLILLQNHGVIALGPTIHAVLASTFMAAKAAEVFMGAAALGGPNFLTPAQVERLTSRPDEAHRQRELKM